MNYLLSILLPMLDLCEIRLVTLPFRYGCDEFVVYAYLLLTVLLFFPLVTIIILEKITVLIHLIFDTFTTYNIIITIIHIHISRDLKVFWYNNFPCDFRFIPFPFNTFTHLSFTSTGWSIYWRLQHLPNHLTQSSLILPVLANVVILSTHPS